MKYLLTIMLMLAFLPRVYAQQATVIDDFTHVAKANETIEVPNPMAVIQSIPDVSNEFTVQEQAHEMMPMDDRDEQVNSEGQSLDPITTQLGITNSYSPGRYATTASGNRLLLISNQPWYEKASPITSYVCGNMKNGHLAIIKELDSKDTWFSMAYRMYNDDSHQGTMSWPKSNNWGIYVDISDATEDIEMMCAVTVSYPVQTNDRDNPTKIKLVTKVLSGKVKAGKAFFSFGEIQWYDDEEKPKLRRNQEIQDVMKIAHISLATRTRGKDSRYAIDQITLGFKGKNYTVNANAGKPVYEPIPRAAKLPDGTEVDVDNVQEP